MATKGLQAAREKSRARIEGGRADREAAARYRELAKSGNWPAEVVADYLARALECDLASHRRS